MGIYEVIEIESQLERIAKENNGEIPDDLLQELVEAEMKSVESIEKMVRFIKHLELFQVTCDSELTRINDLKSEAKNRVGNIKKFMTPFIKDRGKFDVSTFKLSTRPSDKLILDDNWINFDYGEKVTPEPYFNPDTNKIKKDLRNGVKIDGARLEKLDNLQIK